jgi:hypothetical protein
LDEPKTLFITESNFRDEPSIFDLSDTVPRARRRRRRLSPVNSERSARAPDEGDNNKKREKGQNRPFSRR